MHPDPDQCSSFSSRLARFSLDRRVTVFVLILTIVVMGLIAAMGLPMELFPRGYETKFLSVYVPGAMPCGRKRWRKLPSPWKRSSPRSSIWIASTLGRARMVPTPS